MEEVEGAKGMRKAGCSTGVSLVPWEWGQRLRRGCADLLQSWGSDWGMGFGVTEGSLKICHQPTCFTGRNLLLPFFNPLLPPTTLFSSFIFKISNEEMPCSQAGQYILDLSDLPCSASESSGLTVDVHSQAWLLHLSKFNFLPYNVLIILENSISSV